MFKKVKRIHFVGIGGIGMSGIAEVLLNLGYNVSGSDIQKSAVTKRLENLGAQLFYGHHAQNVAGADVLVISSAIGPHNEEVLAGKDSFIPVIRRAEMLAELMRMKYGVVVAGSHGKTTTTSMVASVLAEAGLDPTIIIGGKVKSFGSNARLGKGDFLVAEADESDGTFLKLSPTIAVVTNVDREHLDFYASIDEIKDSFLCFANSVPFYGASILCLDDENIQNIIPKVEKRYVSYGIENTADVMAKELVFDGTQMSFQLFFEGKGLGQVSMSFPGLHNVYNALAACAVGLELGLSINSIKQALSAHKGVERRFQIKSYPGGILIVDDYGHHPTEIRATLLAAKEHWGRRTITVFQPHRYTRTKYLFSEFCSAFYNTDVLIVMDIYPAGETSIEGVSGEALVTGIKQHGKKNVYFAKDMSSVLKLLLDLVGSEDMVITLGAGDVWKVGEELGRCIKSRLEV